jgi:hypothetical protein
MSYTYVGEIDRRIETAQPDQVTRHLKAGTTVCLAATTVRELHCCAATGFQTGEHQWTLADNI